MLTQTIEDGKDFAAEDNPYVYTVRLIERWEEPLEVLEAPRVAQGIPKDAVLSLKRGQDFSEFVRLIRNKSKTPTIAVENENLFFSRDVKENAGNGQYAASNIKKEQTLVNGSKSHFSLTSFENLDPKIAKMNTSVNPKALFPKSQE